jgi:hypothetical protein
MLNCGIARAAFPAMMWRRNPFRKMRQPLDFETVCFERFELFAALNEKKYHWSCK